METSKLSALQLMLLLFITVFTTAEFVVPAPTALHAGSDMWFAPIWSIPAGIIACGLAYRLHRLYPGQNVMEFLPQLLGKIPGKLVGLLIVVSNLQIASLVLREYVEYIMGSFLDSTPMIVIAATVILVCAYAVHGGVEVLGKCSLIFVPLAVITLFVTLLFLLPDLEVRNALPFMENGPFPSITGSYVSQGWLSELWVATFFLPFLPARSRPLRAMVGTVFVTVLSLVLINSVSLFLFGVLTKELNYPILVAVRYVSYTNFIEHMEAAGMAVWVLALILKLSVFYYASVVSTARLFSLPNYQPLTLPIGGVIMTTALFLFPNRETMAKFLSTEAPVIFLSSNILLPLLLWVIAEIRRKPAGKGAPSS